MSLHVRSSSPHLIISSSSGLRGSRNCSGHWHYPQLPRLCLGNEHSCERSHAINRFGSRLRRHWRRGTNILSLGGYENGKGRERLDFMFWILEWKYFTRSIFRSRIILEQAFGTARVYSVEGNVFFGSARHFEVKIFIFSLFLSSALLSERTSFRASLFLLPGLWPCLSTCIRCVFFLFSICPVRF
jgi:hypothetical protein